jgi:Ser/Thr protein kinase RdoA (MazF antagonist)
MRRLDEVMTVARRLIGPCEVVADLSWTELGLAVVVEVRTGAGDAAIVKAHAEDGRHEIEVAAYEQWVPAIADRAPRLLAVDRPSRVVVLSRLDADAPGDDLGLDTYRDAGALLRRFHEAGAPTVDEEWAAGRLENLRQWIDRLPAGLLEDDDVTWVETEAAVLRDLPPPACVPCHGDWQPRNWRVDDAGRVHTFDFERARRDWWIHDIQRMWWREWIDRPDRREAFLSGYGRQLDDVDVAGLRARSAIGHLVQVVWATEHGDEAFAADGRANLARMRAVGL